MHTCESLSRRGDYYGVLAFAGTGLGAFSTYLFAYRINGQPWAVALTFLLGGAFILLGVVSKHFVSFTPSPRRTIYFAVQITLGLSAILVSPLRGFFGILLLPIISQFILFYPWRQGVAFCFFGYLASCSVFLVLYGWPSFWEAVVSFSPAYLFTGVFTFVTRDALHAREHAMGLSTQLEAANQRLRDQADQTAELATTRERNRLAREIHDGVGHYLTVINIQLEAARSVLASDPTKAATALERATQLSREALDDVRRSVGSLRTEETRRSLPDALRDLTVDAGLPVDFQLAGEPRPLPANAEHALFRAAQEGLTNVRKHAHATRAQVELCFAADHRIRLEVRDDGQGPDRSRDLNAGTGAGFGLRGMRERVALLGGEVRTVTPANGGFLLTVEVPA